MSAQNVQVAARLASSLTVVAAHLLQCLCCGACDVLWMVAQVLVTSGQSLLGGGVMESPCRVLCVRWAAVQGGPLGR